MFFLHGVENKIVVTRRACLKCTFVKRVKAQGYNTKGDFSKIESFEIFLDVFFSLRPREIAVLWGQQGGHSGIYGFRN